MNKLWLRLAFGFLFVTWGIIGATAASIEASVAAGFSNYIQQSNTARFGNEQISEIEAHYAEQRSWEGVEQFLIRGQNVPAQRQGHGAQVFIADSKNLVVAATNPAWIGLNAGEIEPRRTLDLTVGGQKVGILGEQTPGTLALNLAEQRFLEDTQRWLLSVAGVGGIVAFGLGIIFSYSLTRPLLHLTDQISRWHMPITKPVITTSGLDEVRQLAQAFNHLLERLQQEEMMRQRMASDVAHELRTPVTIIRGHLEAMMDGIYPLDIPHLAVAYNQTLHLARLVEDMRLLTQAETGHLPLHYGPVQIENLIDQVIDQFSPLAQDSEIELLKDISDSLPLVLADYHRVQQVFDNLLSNALRHTPAGGQIRVRVQPEPSSLRISLCNSGSTLTPDEITHLFDRFWRADEARERDQGGSGLGLAITRELLRLHHSEITAYSTSDGVCFTFSLPTQNHIISI